MLSHAIWTRVKYFTAKKNARDVVKDARENTYTINTYAKARQTNTFTLLVGAP